MNNTVNLEEILKEYLTVNTMRANNPDYTFMMVLSAMKEAVRRVLELAAENAQLLEDGEEIGKAYTIHEYDTYYTTINLKVSEESILNTINQVV